MVLFSWSLLASDSLTVDGRLPGSIHMFSTDALGNVYVVKENNILVRYNEKGDSTGIFNEIRKGKLRLMDATNPLRLLLFFQDYNQIIVLDNMLSKKNVIRLNTLGLYNVTAIANSADGLIWVYDALQATLYKIDDKPSVRQSMPLRNVVGYIPSFHSMVEEERTLYAADSTHGILRFDLFGFYHSTLPFITPYEIQCVNAQLVFRDSASFVAYHLTSMRDKRILLPHQNGVDQVRVQRGLLWIREGDQLIRYRITEP